MRAGHGAVGDAGLTSHQASKARVFGSSQRAGKVAEDSLPLAAAQPVSEDCDEGLGTAARSPGEGGERSLHGQLASAGSVEPAGEQPPTQRVAALEQGGHGDHGAACPACSLLAELNDDLDTVEFGPPEVRAVRDR